ncbi:MAG: hypothetical protein ACPGJE_05740 [Wenzhouxiangellaceae bacterium]
MHPSQIQFPIESIPAPPRTTARPTLLRAVPSRESGAAPRRTDATLESSDSNPLITLARELAAATGLLLWLGACIVAASMVV